MATVAASRAERRIRGAEKPDDHVLVIFGATGDLSRRKLLPGLFHLAETGLLPDGYRIVGASHQDLSDDEFRDFARGASEQFGVLKPSDRSCDWQAFAQRSSYVGGGFGPGSSDAVTEAVARAESELSGARRLFFFAVPPGAFGPIVQGLAEAGLNENARVIMEKPFGTDLKSAKELNALVHALFAEEQVFRIDHFLARKRSRTSSPFALRTACSSRSGTATTLTTCRSTCPRRSRSRSASASTTPPVPSGTWW